MFCNVLNLFRYSLSILIGKPNYSYFLLKSTVYGNKKGPFFERPFVILFILIIYFFLHRPYVGNKRQRFY